MKKEYKTPVIEIQAMELGSLLQTTQITTTIGEGEVGSGDPNLSRSFNESPYREPSFQDEDDWDAPSGRMSW